MLGFWQLPKSVGHQRTRNYLHTASQSAVCTWAPDLFTGSGFSMAAKNIGGRGLPSGPGLRELLWPNCFLGDPFEESSTLPDLYDFAMRRAPGSCPSFSPVHLPSRGTTCQSGTAVSFRCLGSGRTPLISTILSKRLPVSSRYHEPFDRCHSAPASPLSPYPSGLEVVHLNELSTSLPQGLRFLQFNMLNGYPARILFSGVWLPNWSAAHLFSLARPLKSQHFGRVSKGEDARGDGPARV